MPQGTMTIDFTQTPKLAGFKCGSIVFTYHYPNGTQDSRHPNPGQKYKGTSRTAYLPDNKMGNYVLERLITCFERRHTFRVGTSVTTGAANSVVWNGIHHKTSPSGGYSSFGYPDKGYFDRVLSELYHKGIK